MQAMEYTETIKSIDCPIDRGVYFLRLKSSLSLKPSKQQGWPQPSYQLLENFIVNYQTFKIYKQSNSSKSLKCFQMIEILNIFEFHFRIQQMSPKMMINLLRQEQYQLIFNQKNLMNQLDDQEVILQTLSLEDILKKEDLALQQFLSIKNIHQKIKSNLVEFVEYCKVNEEFTFQLIDTGIKCPMHQSTNSNMKKITYIACDILTSDNDAIADLLILNGGIIEVHSSDEQKQIFEDITEETDEQVKEEEQEKPKIVFQDNEKYKYLLRLTDYMENQEIDENCLNYMIKAMNCVIRKKTNEFYEFLISQEKTFKKIIELAYYPCVSQFIAKMVSEDENSKKFYEQKAYIIKKIIEKIHKQIQDSRCQLTLEFIEEIFSTNKYSDSQGRSQLQVLSDIFVSKEEISFHIQNSLNVLCSCNPLDEKMQSKLINSISYLLIVSKRINTDQEPDPYSYEESKPKEPTLKFECDEIYKNYGSFIEELEKILSMKFSKEQDFKLFKVKYFEFIANLSKYSKIQNFYKANPLDSRERYLECLINFFIQDKKSGIVRTYLIGLFEKLLKFEENIFKNSENLSISAETINKFVTKYKNNIQNRLAQSQPKHNSNKDEFISYFNKLLILFDNYIKSLNKKESVSNESNSIFDHFPQIKLETITKAYSQKLALKLHPNGTKIKMVDEFEFLSASLKQQTQTRKQVPTAADLIQKFDEDNFIDEAIKTASESINEVKQAINQQLTEVKPEPVEEESTTKKKPKLKLNLEVMDDKISKIKYNRKNSQKSPEFQPPKENEKDTHQKIILTPVQKHQKVPIAQAPNNFSLQAQKFYVKHLFVF